MGTVLEKLGAREKESLQDLNTIAQKRRDVEFGISGGYGIRAHVLPNHQRSTFDLDFVVRREHSEALISEIQKMNYDHVRGRMREKMGFALGFRKKTPYGVIRADVSVDDVYDRYRTKLRYRLTPQVMEDRVQREITGIFTETKTLVPVLCAEDLLILKALPSRPADQVDICSLLTDVKIDFERLKGRLSDPRIADGFSSGLQLLGEAIASGDMEQEVKEKIGLFEPASWKMIQAQLRKCLACVGGKPR